MVKKKRVVIVGGGFGGLKAVKALRKADVDILLIDRMNHHLFQPLLYQVATAALSPGNIASPLREILRHHSNVTVIMKDVVDVDKANRLIVMSDGTKYVYDSLILAPGARHDYFGHQQWEAFAPGLKTIVDALSIREKILTAFENAECCSDAAQVEAYMRFIIVGGGPTGVEMAGAIAEIAKQSLLKNFRHINPEQAEIILIEGFHQLLPSYPLELANAAVNSLEKMGVKVMVNTKVTDINHKGVFVGDNFIPSATIIWAAGNRASPLLKTLDVPLDAQGRVMVEFDLSIRGHPEIFVIGDAVHLKDKNGVALPGIAPVAIQQGGYVADILRRDLGTASRKPFIYRDKGMMATIGRAKAVAVMGKLKISGFMAWIAWGLIHIFYLIGFQNRLFVLLHWFYLYVIGSRNVRLITNPISEYKKNRINIKKQDV